MKFSFITLLLTDFQSLTTNVERDYFYFKNTSTVLELMVKASTDDSQLRDKQHKQGTRDFDD